MEEFEPYFTTFVPRLLCFTAIYLLGYYGIGIFTILFSLIVLWLYKHRQAALKVKSARKNETKPLWLQDVNVGRVEWINQIVENVWAHFDTFLSTFIAEALYSKGMF